MEDSNSSFSIFSVISTHCPFPGGSQSQHLRGRPRPPGQQGPQDPVPARHDPGEDQQEARHQAGLDDRQSVQARKVWRL